MITINGKYNHAKVFANEIEESCRNQIQQMVDHPAFAKTHIAIMPDTHGGAGSVIGFTMKMNEYIIPNVIGVDIGCFSGDTKVPLLDGITKTFEQLVQEGKDVWVYSMDKDLHIVPAKASRSRKTIVKN